jgi:hypothetical protein
MPKLKPQKCIECGKLFLCEGCEGCSDYGCDVCACNTCFGVVSRFCGREIVVKGFIFR